MLDFLEVLFIIFLQKGILETINGEDYMQVINNCSFPVLVFSWSVSVALFGKDPYTADVEIKPGESAKIMGPYIGEMGGGSCCVDLGGADISCHELADDGIYFQVMPGLQLNLATDEDGICVRHYSEDRKLVCKFI